MKLTSLFYSIALTGTLFLQTNAQPQAFTPTNNVLQAPSKEALILVKRELETSKKLLIQIRDSADPGIVRSATHALGTVFKEITYIVVATGLVGCFVGGAAMILAPAGDLFNNQFGAGLLLIGTPIALTAVFVNYLVLKLIFGKLLANSEETKKSIKEALTLIDQTLNKLDYELEKIERLAHA